MRFGRWLQEQQALLEGGNVKIGDHSAVPIDLMKHKRSEVQGHIHDFLHSVHDHVHEHGKEHLFGRNAQALHTGSAYAGSTKEFMNKETSDHTFRNVYGKHKVGDIDCMVPHHHLEKGSHLEKALQPGQNHGHYSVVGTKRVGTQLHALIKHKKSGETHQVDFEGAHYKGHHPSKWNQLSTNSHPEDMKAGIKGVHHKLLLNAAIKGAHTIHGVHVMKNGKVKSEGEHPVKTFAVSSGMRVAYKHTGEKHESGHQILHKVESKDKPTYITSPDRIAKHTFDHNDSRTVNDMHSFHGVLRNMKRHFSPEQVHRTISHYHDVLKRTDPDSPETKKSLEILKKHT